MGYPVNNRKERKWKTSWPNSRNIPKFTWRDWKKAKKISLFFIFSCTPKFELTTYRSEALLFGANPPGTVFLLIVVVLVVVVLIVVVMRTVKQKHHNICKHIANIQDWSSSQRKQFLRQTCHHIGQEFYSIRSRISNQSGHRFFVADRRSCPLFRIHVFFCAGESTSIITKFCAYKTTLSHSPQLTNTNIHT